MRVSQGLEKRFERHNPFTQFLAFSHFVCFATGYRGPSSDKKKG